MGELVLYSVSSLAFGFVAVIKMRDGDRPYAALYALITMLSIGAAAAAWGAM